MNERPNEHTKPSVRTLRAIEVTYLLGTGVTGDPVRQVRTFYELTPEGELVELFTVGLGMGQR